VKWLNVVVSARCVEVAEMC